MDFDWNRWWFSFIFNFTPQFKIMSKTSKHEESPLGCQLLRSILSKSKGPDLWNPMQSWSMNESKCNEKINYCVKHAQYYTEVVNLGHVIQTIFFSFHTQHYTIVVNLGQEVISNSLSLHWCLASQNVVPSHTANKSKFL